MPSIELKCFSTIDGERGFSIIDIAPALLTLSRRLDVEYNYQVTTMDGKKHEDIRAMREEFSFTLGCDKTTDSGTILGEVAYLVALSQKQKDIIEFIYNGVNEGVCYVKLGQTSANKVKNDDFEWDLLDMTITLERSGSIEN